MNLDEIENRIVDIKKEIHEIPRKNHQPVAQSILDARIALAKKPLEEELEILETKRKFIIDKRNNFRSKLFWNLLIPILVSLLTTYLTLKFGLKL